MKRAELFVTIAVAGLTITPLSADTLYDNGAPNGENGFSNATAGVFGFRRTVLDDFVVPVGATWTIADFHWHHVWSSLPPGSGSAAELILWSDAGERPGMPIQSLFVTSYDEAGTGNTFFSRAEVESWVGFNEVTLDAGTYWIEWTIAGPENNFVLTTQRNGTAECWVNYEDLGGLQPGGQFDAFDLAWSLTGVPGAAGLPVLVAAGMVPSRRRAARGRERRGRPM